MISSRPSQSELLQQTVDELKQSIITLTDDNQALSEELRMKSLDIHHMRFAISILQDQLRSAMMNHASLLARVKDIEAKI